MFRSFFFFYLVVIQLRKPAAMLTVCLFLYFMSVCHSFLVSHRVESQEIHIFPPQKESWHHHHHEIMMMRFSHSPLRFLGSASIKVTFPSKNNVCLSVFGWKGNGIGSFLISLISHVSQHRQGFRSGPPGAGSGNFSAPRRHSIWNIYSLHKPEHRGNNNGFVANKIISQTQMFQLLVSECWTHR